MNVMKDLNYLRSFCFYFCVPINPSSCSLHTIETFYQCPFLPILFPQFSYSSLLLAFLFRGSTSMMVVGSNSSTPLSQPPPSPRACRHSALLCKAGGHWPTHLRAKEQNALGCFCFLFSFWRGGSLFFPICIVHVRSLC